MSTVVLIFKIKYYTVIFKLVIKELYNLKYNSLHSLVYQNNFEHLYYVSVLQYHIEDF